MGDHVNRKGTGQKEGGRGAGQQSALRSVHRRATVNRAETRLSLPGGQRRVQRRPSVLERRQGVAPGPAGVRPARRGPAEGNRAERSSSARAIRSPTQEPRFQDRTASSPSQAAAPQPPAVPPHRLLPPALSDYYPLAASVDVPNSGGFHQRNCSIRGLLCPASFPA